MVDYSQSLIDACRYGMAMSSLPSSDQDKELIRNALLVSYQEVFQALLERVKRLVVLDDAGNARFMVPRERLTDTEKIGLQLIARKFAKTIDLTPTETMSADELSRIIGKPAKTISARIAGMRREGWIDADERGAYRIRYTAIEELVNKIEARAGGSP